MTDKLKILHYKLCAARVEARARGAQRAFDDQVWADAADAFRGEIDRLGLTYTNNHDSRAIVYRLSDGRVFREDEPL